MEITKTGQPGLINSRSWLVNGLSLGLIERRRRMAAVAKTAVVKTVASPVPAHQHEAGNPGAPHAKQVKDLIDAARKRRNAVIATKLAAWLYPARWFR